MHTHIQTMLHNCVMIALYHLELHHTQPGQHALQRSGQLSALQWIPVRLFVGELVQHTSSLTVMA